MAVKETIAFIGNKKNDLRLPEKLAAQNFPVIIVTAEEGEKESVLRNYEKEKAEAEIEFLDCPRTGCWEADIIALSGTADFEMDILKKVDEFATQKIVVCISELNSKSTFSVEQLEEIQQGLPNSKLVPVLVDPEKDKVFISGKDPGAVEKVNSIFENIDFERGNKE